MNILQNNAVVTFIPKCSFCNIICSASCREPFSDMPCWSYSICIIFQYQHQRGAANGISVTAMSLFKTCAPAGAGILWVLFFPCSCIYYDKSDVLGVNCGFPWILPTAHIREYYFVHIVNLLSFMLVNCLGNIWDTF